MAVVKGSAVNPVLREGNSDRRMRTLSIHGVEKTQETGRLGRMDLAA